MLLESLLLCGQVLVSISVLVVGNALIVNFPSDLEQSLFFLFKSDLSISDLHREFAIPSLLEINFFSCIVIFGSHTLIVSTEGRIFTSLFVYGVFATTDLSLSILKCDLFIAEVMGSCINDLRDVLNTSPSTHDFVFKLVQLFMLMVCLNLLALIHLLKPINLTEHLSSLHFYSFDFAFKLSLLVSQVSDLVPFDYALISQSLGFNIFLI